MIEALWLIKNGMAEDTAFGLPDDYRTAFSIVFSQFEGNKFNWSSMEFEKSE